MNEQTKKIIIIGGGGHAKVLLDILTLRKDNVIGFTDVEPKDQLGIKYLGGDDAVQQYDKEDVCLVNAIGSVKRPQKRQKIYEQFKSWGYTFAQVIHPQAIISTMGVGLGEGVQIMAGVVINPGVKIGENAIINTKSSVDHDCTIGAHTHVAPGVTMCGDITIGQGCHIGSGVTIIQGLTIGDRKLIAAGETIRAGRGAVRRKKVYKEGLVR